MGGKASVPSAPDYSPLIAGLGKVIEQSLGYSKDQMAWAKKAYEDNKKTGNVIQDFSLGALDKLQAWADSAQAEFEGVTIPLMHQQAAFAQEYATPERMEERAGAAEADVAAQFEQARQVAMERMRGFGVDPTQMRMNALDLGTRVAEGAAAASAGNQARRETELTGQQLIANAIAQGQGQQQMAMAGMGAAGAAGNQAVNIGLADTASGAQTMGTPYQWMGLGAQGYGQQGQLMNAGFENQMAAYNAKNQQSSGWGGLLGNIAGTALMFAEEGGVIPDEEGQYVDPSMSPSGGAIEDDIDAQVAETGQPAQINAGEFIMPKDVVAWLGEKGMQQIVLKARKEMGSEEQRPAQPEIGPPPTPQRGIGAIPDMEDVA